MVLTNLNGTSICEGDSIVIEQVYFENWKGERQFRAITENDIELIGFKQRKLIHMTLLQIIYKSIMKKKQVSVQLRSIKLPPALIKVKSSLERA